MKDLRILFFLSKMEKAEKEKTPSPLKDGACTLGGNRTHTSEDTGF